MNKTFFSILFFSVFLMSPVTGKQKSDFRVVGYYSMQSAMTDFSEFPFKRVTHVNLFFLNPDTAGNYSQDFSAYEPFIKKAHKKGVKVLFSIGGGSAHPYYHRLLQDDRRGLVIQNLIDIVIKYDLDGLDNDLENGDIDKNYEDFTVELKSALAAHNKILTAAIVVASPDLFSDKALAQYDFVNVMSYDHTGPWRPDKPGQHASYQHSVDDLEYFGVKRGIAAKDMNLGVPFYGYGFGPELTSEPKSMNFSEIAEIYKGSESLDELSIEDGYTMYYNGILTIRKKTQLAMGKAGGVMIWQLDGDAKGSKSLLKTICDTAFSK